MKSMYPYMGTCPWLWKSIKCIFYNFIYMCLNRAFLNQFYTLREVLAKFNFWYYLLISSILLEVFSNRFSESKRKSLKRIIEVFGKRHFFLYLHHILMPSAHHCIVVWCTHLLIYILDYSIRQLRLSLLCDWETKLRGIK